MVDFKVHTQAMSGMVRLMVAHNLFGDEATQQSHLPVRAISGQAKQHIGTVPTDLDMHCKHQLQFFKVNTRSLTGMPCVIMALHVHHV